MKVLLLRPVPPTERFGLGPFFRIEPLGMEYVAAALEARGHDVTLVDLRFSRPVEHYLKTRPQLVGIACMHALEIDAALDLVATVKRLAPASFVVVGGHSAAAYPQPFFRADVDAVSVDDGERAVPALVEALAIGMPIAEVPGLVIPETGSAVFRHTPTPPESLSLDEVPLPARHHVDPWRHNYACLLFRPTWLVETARGCPFRCSFCSVWQLFDRSFRERSIDAVCRDLRAVGPHVFIADDLFWNHAARSADLAAEVNRRGIRKRWALVQSRTDIVARHPELLEAWRPFAQEIDIFFGLEAATNEGLDGLVKDTTVDRTAEAVAIARELRYEVTGNFVIDPAWDERDFEKLWDFVDTHRLHRAGFTILTPLPGTTYFEQERERIRAVDWSQFDMHHLLWEPKLGAHRFFELYCATWRRSILNLGGEKKWWNWASQVPLRNLLFLTQALRRTQRMMRPEAYLSEFRLREIA